MQAASGSGQHHMVGDDRGIDVGDIFAVYRPNPGFSRCCADDERQRRVVDIGGLSQLRPTFFALYHQDALMLSIGASRR